MAEGMDSLIATIVEATGLPPETWSVIPPLQTREVSHTLGPAYTDSMMEYPSYNRVQLRHRTISALQNLPVAHILGQGVLIRTETKFTALVSIAEAAFVLLGKTYSDLLWAMLEFSGQELRADAANEKRLYGIVHVREEITEAEELRRQERAREMNRRMGKGRKRLGKESDTSEELSDLRLEQKKLVEKLDSIQEQNKQMLQLLKEAIQGGTQADKTLTARLEGRVGKLGTVASPTLGETGDKSSETVPYMAGNHPKYYKTSSLLLYLRRNDAKWFILTPNSKAEFSFLADWLEVALGGRGFATSSSLLSGCIRLEDENEPFWREDIHQSSTPKVIHGCWRKRIVSGNILGLAPSMAAKVLGKESFSCPFPQCEDGLLLSAAALWSLFDNALERMLHCKCTFRSESGSFIQCKAKSGKWFLWHTFSNETPCNGQSCETNVCVALTAKELGERIYTTSPCVLGWAAQSRTKPDSPLWETLKVTKGFRNKELAKYNMKEFQALAQLGIPGIVSPQVGGAITFSKTNYEVSNSIDHASILAMEMAAMTIVLIFDERRGFHFSCDGADIIEVLCLQYLGAVDCDPSSFPPFTHPTALQRLKTWYKSSFVSPIGTYITGDHLVREASKKVSQLIEFTKNASNDKTILYWLLEDVLRGNVGKAIKAPRGEHTSWHELAFHYPPLVFAVGEVHAKLITANDYSLKWTKSKSNTISKNLFHSYSGPGGIVGCQVQLKRWLAQAQPFYRANCQTLSLSQTNNQVVFGPSDADSEYTYAVVECSKEKAPLEGIFASCQECPRKGTQRCLHYIQ